MNTLTIGLFTGLLLGVAAAAGGFWGFVVTALLGLVGAAVAGQVSGEIDVTAVLRGRDRE
ncbi:hypothetical protein [Jiangella mangrovi]|uniref:Putative membrane protein YeaQ/YmgE (Transglycosylase-associated protein family) n=1 Tax=Jiangella mangrovi TaxID=1524084 RepID=A0A7W9GUV4_9ACTN|nr:hypothetical protein [Jiangella mangrovi]MBB5790460.1 putative membrane protein YeaQ/YmgE (transglycosylase-associated protein family) [Jiangella mangrovi]